MKRSLPRKLLAAPVLVHVMLVSSHVSFFETTHSCLSFSCWAGAMVDVTLQHLHVHTNEPCDRSIRMERYWANYWEFTNTQNGVTSCSECQVRTQSCWRSSISIRYGKFFDQKTYFGIEGGSEFQSRVYTMESVSNLWIRTFIITQTTPATSKLVLDLRLIVLVLVVYPNCSSKHKLEYWDQICFTVWTTNQSQVLTSSTAITKTN